MKTEKPNGYRLFLFFYFLKLVYYWKILNVEKYTYYTMKRKEKL